MTSSGTTGDDLCLGGTLCGQPASCCPMGNECIEGACLPACESEVRCGPKLEVCCEAGDVCSGDACVTPGAPCSDSYDCMPGEYCEPTLMKCLPQPDPLTCELVPDFDALEVTLEWKYDLEHIISIPVVADLNGDGTPEVVVNATQKDGLSWPGGVIIALDGTTGAELWRVDNLPAMMKYGSHGRSTIAAGDVSGDGLPDIVYAGRPDGNGRSRIYAIDGTGKFLWASRTAANQPFVTTVENGAATLVNLDADAAAEVVFGAAVLDNDGLNVWNQGGNGGTFGTSGSYTGGISAAVDLDGDMVPEIVSGRNAWKVDWKVVNNAPSVTLTQLWVNNDGGDGYPAIADLDLNGTPEVILAANGTIRAIDGKTGKLWCGVDPSGVACQNNDAARTKALNIRGGGLGGPPTVADFDGDGKPEVGIAGATAYAVYDFNRMGEEIVKPMGDPNPAAGAIFVRWFKTTQDASSNATGSSVFDFQGDGAAEVVYADECFMRVYSGIDGTVQLQVQNSTGTIHEYPLVVDVDGDGNSEILVVANNPANPCGGVPNYVTRRGIYAYGDVNDKWVPTREVWTSHTYHVTNVTSQGNVPDVENDNWTTPGLNNYRQNSQGAGVFNAPDLGSRTAMENPFGSNNKAMSYLVFAELAEGKGRFINQIVNGVWYSCDMSSWVLSAHLPVQKSGRTLPDFNEQIIDLTSAELGSFYSWIYYFFHDEFDKINPIISARLKLTIQQRILQPYIERSDYWWQALSKPGVLVNNWNPWCNFNVLTCYLLMEDDSDKLSTAVYKTMQSVDESINYVKEDGACEEGPSYWGHAAG
ncbi:MAG TPA: hypothetical protein PKW35_14850, partial [Nannocystaceae bacterium]|nr:hypothetical protein [Nannocystaceae bacterium]